LPFNRLHILSLNIQKGEQITLYLGPALHGVQLTPRDLAVPAHALNRSTIGALVAVVALNKNLFRGF
jgi:hypothetical protein